MRWLVWGAGIVVGIVALIGIVGALLPRRHVAAVRLELAQPPERVFELLADIEGATAWRSDLKQVEILSAAPLRWRETTGFGAVVMAREEADAPRRLVGRIDDPDQPFGGRWIHELEPTAAGTTLTITEDGEVYNPFFRFIGRFVIGHHRTLETYTRDLARQLGETAQPQRMAPRRD